MWMVDVLLFSKIVTKGGGVNEREIRVFAVVTSFVPMVYKRFS
jgi:hypothetical protein